MRIFTSERVEDQRGSYTTDKAREMFEGYFKSIRKYYCPNTDDYRFPERRPHAK